MTPAARAVAHVRRRAEAAREDARSRIAQLLELAHQPSNAPDALAQRIRHAEITLNFHPDRRRTDGLTVAEGMLEDGEYKSQFETGLSNGSRTAFHGGDRDRWEAHLFGGAYHEPLPSWRCRPKYGALNVMQHSDGGSPRFGSCYVILAHHVAPRCTFTWGDSHMGPADVGTTDVLEPLIAALLREVIEQGRAFGVNGLTVSDLVHSPLSSHEGPADQAWQAPGRALDDYIEAQVHDTLAIGKDVAALVIDPSFDDTPTGAVLHQLCERHQIPTRRHAGFTLRPREVDADFRGPRMVALAALVAERYGRADGLVDPVAIGRAADSLYREPSAWEHWGTHDETLQHLKQLWHVLVRFGQPHGGTSRGGALDDQRAL